MLQTKDAVKSPYRFLKIQPRRTLEDPYPIARRGGSLAPVEPESSLSKLMLTLPHNWDRSDKPAIQKTLPT